MKYLRQNTAAVVPIGPFSSPSTGLAVDGLGSQSGRLVKAGAGSVFTPSSWAQDGTAGGQYLVGLASGDADTLGRSRVYFDSPANYLPCWEDFTVLSPAVYDELFGTLAPSAATWSTIVKAGDGEASPFPAGSAGSSTGGYERFPDGIARGGSATSITLAAGEPDALYRTIDIIGGTGESQARSIIDFNFSTKVALVDRPWLTPPDSTSQYVLGFPNTGARLDLAQSLVDGKPSTVGGALNGAWATAFGAIQKNVITRALSLFGWSSPTVPLATFLLDDVADPKTRTPQ